MPTILGTLEANVDPKTRILQLVNSQEGSNTQLADVSFGTPEIPPEENRIRNTRVLITPLASTGLYGSKQVWYNRINASTLGVIQVSKGSATTVYQLLSAINTYCGSLITTDDVYDAALPAPDGNGQVIISLNFKPTSLLFYGGAVISLLSGFTSADRALLNSLQNQTFNLSDSIPSNLAASPSAGVSQSVSRSDHTHALPPIVAVGNNGLMTSAMLATLNSLNAMNFLQLTSTAPSALGTQAVGTATTAARADHVHQLPAIATTSANGLMSSSMVTTLNNLVSNGTGVQLSTTLPAALGVAAVGVGTTSARADHVHDSPPLASGSVNGLLSSSMYTSLNTLLSTNFLQLGNVPGAGLNVASAGVATTAARSDHAHALPPDATAGNKGLMTTAHVATLTNLVNNQNTLSLGSATPSALASTPSSGASTYAAKEDHVHPLPPIASTSVNGLMTAAMVNTLNSLAGGGTGVQLSTDAPAALGATASVGVAATAARGDHVHALPAIATTSVAGLMSAAMLTTLNNLAAANYLQLGSALPNGPGTASAGVSNLAARQDHVHPTTSVATISSDGLMASVDKATLNTLASTTFVQLGNSVAAALGTASAGTANTAARSDHVHPAVTVNVAWSGITGKPTTLSTFGITDFVNTNVGSNVDLNTLTTPGSYRYDTGATNSQGVNYAAMLVFGNADTRTQLVGDYNTGNLWTRSGIYTNADWKPWRKLWDNINLTSLSQLSNSSTGFINATGAVGNPDNGDTYMNFRVMRNSNSASANDGMYIGFGNSNGGLTRIYGGGSVSNNVIVDATGGLQTSGNIKVGTAVGYSGISFGTNIGKAIAVYEGAGGANLYGIGMNGSGAPGNGNPYRTQLFTNGVEAVSLGYSGRFGFNKIDPLNHYHFKTVSGTALGMVFENGNGGTDAKLNDVVFDPTGTIYRFVNDAYSVANSYYSVNRSGMNVTGHNWFIGSNQLAMSLDSSGRLLLAPGTNRTALAINVDGYDGRGIDITQTGSDRFPWPPNIAVSSGAPLNRVSINESIKPTYTSAESVDRFVTGFQFYHNYGSGEGNRMAVEFGLVMTSQMLATNRGQNFCSAAFRSESHVPSNGMLPGGPGLPWFGSIFGSNPIGSLFNGATGYNGVFGSEVNVDIQNGASAFMKGGVSIAANPVDYNRASGYDRFDTNALIDGAILISNQGNHVTWKHGILFHSQNGYFPLGDDSTVIKTAAGSFLHGIDFSTSTILGNAFRSRGFEVDSLGNIELGRKTATSIAGQYIDFNTSGNSNDYDFRLKAFGGGSSNAQGILYTEGHLSTSPSTAVRPGLSVPPGVAPNNPTDGNFWTTTSGVFVRLNNQTIQLNAGATGAGPIFLSDYCTGNTTTDVTSQVNNAIALAISTGRSLYVPPGRYYIYGVLLANLGDFHMYGDSPNQCVFVFAHANATFQYRGIGGTTQLPDYDTSGQYHSTQCIIERIGFAVNSQNTARKVLDATWTYSTLPNTSGSLAKTLTVMHCDFYAMPATGTTTQGSYWAAIYMQNAGNTTIMHNRFMGGRDGAYTSSYGTYIDAASGTSATEHYIQNNNYSYYNTGIFFGGFVEGVNIHYNVIMECLYDIIGNCGTGAQGRPGIYIRDNHMTAYNAGILIAGFCQIDISQNLMYFLSRADKTDYTGIWLNYQNLGGLPLDSKVSGNNMQVTGSYGSTNVQAIRISHTTGGLEFSIIQSNILRNFNTGVMLDGGVNNVKVYDSNMYLNVPNAFIDNSGTGQNAARFW